MKSLNWLVQGARKQDYRYFHFSGHGEIFESSSGKEARLIPKRRQNVKKNDTELYGAPSGGRHVTSQSIRATELKRYCEALSAYCHDKPPHAESNFDFADWESCYRICDEELNQVFSRLPEGCRLTCTLDCCHSARIANNNFKLLGAGFRGSMIGDSNSPPVKPSRCTHMSHTIHRTRGGTEVSKGVILRNGSNDNPSPAIQISCPSQLPFDEAVLSEEFQAVNLLDQIGPSEYSRGLIDFATSVYRYFSPPRTSTTSKKIRMEEKLPDEEIQKDKIIADMLTWGGCHQRQLAGEFADGPQKGGYFTSAFVEAVNDIPNDKSIKICELFDNVNAKVIEKMGQYMERKKEVMKEAEEHPQAHSRTNADNDSMRIRGVNPQYIQLWTSLGNGTEDSAHAKLDNLFII
ncbi:hypothetical protein B0J17DRAFT_682350 [Rhizoctonia solani]|nr:hypothetical protein B0J17DRAFT_682350 [Rhizoctonia solani]